MIMMIYISTSISTMTEIFNYNRYDCSWDKDGNLIIVGLNEELTRDNTVLYDDYAADDEMNGFHNYSYYDSIDDSDKL